MTDLRAAALAYATRGTPIIPCNGKVPIGTDWQHRVSNDPDQVSRWWREMPNANIGFIPISVGLLSLDIDSAAAEEVALRLGAFAEPAPTVATGRRFLPVTNSKYFARACHRYFRAPVGLDFTRIPLDIMLDVRRAGCQNLLPPSLHPETGAAYTWEDKSPAGELPPGLLTALRAAVTPRTRPSASIHAGVSRVTPIADTIPEGNRDTTLASIAGALRHRGCSEGVILAALEGVNREYCRPPLAARDLERIARSIGRYRPAGEDHLQETAAHAEQWRREYVP